MGLGFRASGKDERIEKVGSRSGKEKDKRIEGKGFPARIRITDSIFIKSVKSAFIRAKKFFYPLP